jgi:signal transduction histidine kinase
MTGSTICYAALPPLCHAAPFPLPVMLGSPHFLSFRAVPSVILSGSEESRVRWQRMVRRSLQIGNLTLELRPPMLDDMGLIPALLALTERVQTQTGLRVDFYHENLDRRFPGDVETAAYRVVQEALTNVARHAGSDSATVRVLAQDVLTVLVSDSGSGFEVEAARASGMSTGLAGMQERASMAGGSLSIDSKPGQGTTIALELPLRGSRQSGDNEC